jgi:hypothetical protein
MIAMMYRDSQKQVWTENIAQIVLKDVKEWKENFQFNQMFKNASHKSVW